MAPSELCIQCGSVIENPPQTGALCAACSARADASEEVASVQRVDRVATFALVLGAVPFFVTYRLTNTSSVTVNGDEVSSRRSSLDYVAVSVGGLVVLLGLAALLRTIRAPAKVRGTRLAMAIGALLLGAVQILRGMI